jgi:hypothetical protein
MASRRRARRVEQPHRPRLAHWRADGEAKTRYRSESEANRACLQARLDHGVDLNAYLCEFCGGWHLGNS